jgi:ATP-dependent protease HslVU (ClpYQ) ATPase subunit
LHKTAPQRYIYKINSSRLKKARWNINISVNEALLNDEIVSISESETIRFIDIENNSSSKIVYSTIKSILKDIKSIKKEPTSISNRDKIKELYAKKTETLLCKDYVAVVVNSEKDFDRMNDEKKAFFINGIRYNYFLGTSGGIKNT